MSSGEVNNLKMGNDVINLDHMLELKSGDASSGQNAQSIFNKIVDKYDKDKNGEVTGDELNDLKSDLKNAASNKRLSKREALNFLKQLIPNIEMSKEDALKTIKAIITQAPSDTSNTSSASTAQTEKPAEQPTLTKAHPEAMDTTKDNTGLEDDPAMQENMEKIFNDNFNNNLKPHKIIVQNGESIEALAKDLGVSVDKILELNGDKVHTDKKGNKYFYAGEEITVVGKIKEDRRERADATTVENEYKADQDVKKAKSAKEIEEAKQAKEAKEAEETKQAKEAKEAAKIKSLPGYQKGLNAAKTGKFGHIKPDEILGFIKGFDLNSKDGVITTSINKHQSNGTTMQIVRYVYAAASKANLHKTHLFKSLADYMSHPEKVNAINAHKIDSVLHATVNEILKNE